ncbi:MAG: S-methyl-5-thioribose-1-phosphate isomerase [Candidatus Verstraetearchaeota archaeon]|nr:S-methyl-5-thioribose-1-phosphate isomerase [Candidatus Verstraetearchaeota archaeon]
MRTIEWKEDGVYIIDQTALPDEVNIIRCEEYERIAKAIERMEVRGAPAIGVAAAMGIALAAKGCTLASCEDLQNKLEDAYERLRKTRPTARNLFWALERMRRTWISASSSEPKELVKRIVSEAISIAEEDVAVCRAIGRNGAELIEDGDGVLTHCNAGALACVEHGTALGVVRSAAEEGKNFIVYATETRPLLQGARLTAFELKNEGIPFRLLTDNMVGYVMRQRLVNKIIVGADLITRYGDVVNKIGTYGIAALARHHGIPFYVAAPLSTIDLAKNIEDVIIEERSPTEVTCIRGIKIAPDGTKVINPAFDITPRELVSGIITEVGVVDPPYDLSLLFRQGGNGIDRVVS